MNTESRNILQILGIRISADYREELATTKDVVIGAMFIEDDLISDNCILENTLYKEDLNLLFFVKYHRLNNYNYFTVNFYDFASKTNFQFYREFPMLYLKEFTSENEILVYISFKADVGNNFYFKLDEEDFYQVNNNN